MKLSITFDRLRLEEKELRKEAVKAGCKTELIDVRKLSFNVTGKRVTNGFGDVVLDVSARKVTVERNDRFEDYTTTTYEV